MLRFVLTQLRTRPARPAALGVAIAVASAAFVLLSSTAETTDVRVQGSVESNFRNAYDILVRPQGSFTETERRQGLVRENYLSGIFGGISLRQWETIREISGVEVAAPIANVGYVLPLSKFGIQLNHVLTDDPVQLYRIRLVWRAQRDLSRYPEDKGIYVYYTRRNRFTSRSEVVPGHPEPLDVCAGFYHGVPYSTGPFDRRAYSYLSCYSERSPETWRENVAQVNRVLGDADVGAEASAYFPVLVAAIDPASEAALLRLDRTVVAGRYLRQDDRPRLAAHGGGQYRAIPVIASTRTFVDEELEVVIERLNIPPGTDVPRVLASRDSYSFLTRQKGTVVDRRIRTVPPLYQQMLDRTRIDSFAYWTVSPTRYHGTVNDRLTALPTNNTIEVWRTPRERLHGGYWPAPPSNADINFRRLTPFTGSNLIGSGGVQRTPSLQVVGRYDPQKLPGFAPLSRLPMETYYPPALAPGDAAARRALRGRPLLPTQNLGDYIQQPPLLLTTLDGMRPFFSPVFFRGARGKAEAPISVIRVRVAGVAGPDELSQERIRRVAIAIRERTGLDVDITAGSSPRRILVELPAGKFGRPALTVEEGWVKKGVSVSFLRALDDKRLAFFALILLSAGIFVANGAFAVVRARRSEIGILLCQGWSRSTIFLTVLGEVVVVGGIAGGIGVLVAAAAASAFSLDVSLERALLVAPVAVVLAFAAGLVPAALAARSVPLDAVRPAVAGNLRRQRVHSIASLALANVTRAPARSLVAAGGLFIGVAALTLIVAVNRAFQGTLVGTLLGEAISIQIRGLDLVAVALVITLAGLSLADVVYLSLRERAPELAALRACGWSDSHLAAMVALEAVWTGSLASAAGVAVGLALGAQLGVPLASLAFAACAAVAGALVVALLASFAPVARLAVLTPTAVLAQE